MTTMVDAFAAAAAAREAADRDAILLDSLGTFIQQWRHYGPQLEGLRQQLLAAGLTDVEAGV